MLFLDALQSFIILFPWGKRVPILNECNCAPKIQGKSFCFWAQFSHCLQQMLGISRSLTTYACVWKKPLFDFSWSLLNRWKMLKKMQRNWQLPKQKICHLPFTQDAKVFTLTLVYLAKILNQKTPFLFGKDQGQIFYVSAKISLKIFLDNLVAFFEPPRPLKLLKTWILCVYTH